MKVKRQVNRGPATDEEIRLLLAGLAGGRGLGYAKKLFAEEWGCSKRAARIRFNEILPEVNRRTGVEAIFYDGGRYVLMPAGRQLFAELNLKYLADIGK